MKQARKFLVLVDLLKKTDYNAKITEIEGKILSISGLPITTVLTTVENKITNVSHLVKKQKKFKKTTGHKHEKYIATPEFNKLTAENFAPRLAEANLTTISDIANFVNKTDFDEKLNNLNKKVTSNKTKHLPVKNEFKKNYKHLIQSIFVVKVILKMMVLKIV